MIINMKKLVILILALVVVVAGLVFFNQRRAVAPKPDENISQPGAKTQFDKTLYSLDDPASLWLVVNKSRPMPLDYVPGELITTGIKVDPSDSAEEQKIKKGVDEVLETMFADAKKAGFDLLFSSGYRSADLQAAYYNSYVKRDGVAAANKYSAKPGTSEHQTGLAFDVARSDRKCYLEICFADTDEGKWLADNAYKYGFTLRYKNGKEDITGYQYEPWHFRYVGAELAAELYNTDQTLEEFFGL